MKTTKDIIREIRNNSAMGFPGIYLIYRKSDKKPYVGQTKLAIRDRLIQHLNNVYVDKESEGIDSAIQKEGADKFEYAVVMPMLNPTAEQLNFGEVIFIDKYDSKDKGYNKTVGNHKGKFTLEDFRTAHVVTKSMTREIVKTFKLKFDGKKVLLVGTFNDEFVNMIKFNTDELEIIDSYTDGSKELAEEFKRMFDERVKEMENKDFDIIISNPPYNKVGCEIDKIILKELNFDKYINLQPMKDFIDDDSDLYKHIVLDSVSVLEEKFADAAVAPYIMEFKKIPNRRTTKTDIRVKAKTDSSLLNVWYEHYDRPEDGWYDWIDSGINPYKYDSQTIIEGVNDLSNGHLPYGARKNDKMWSYLYNTNQIDCNELVDNKKRKDKSYANSLRINFTGYHCKTQLIHNNIVKFIYSDEGFRFLSKMATSYNTSKPESFFKNVLPRVDWTREWTVEEILKDYGYTAKEIQEVIDDLKNFRGMNV